MEATQERIIVYGHDWCSHAAMLKRELEAAEVPHEWRDIMRGEPGYKEELRALARGNLSVPTVLFPDGTVLIEPRTADLFSRLGIESRGWAERIKGWVGGG